MILNMLVDQRRMPATILIAAAVRTPGCFFLYIVSTLVGLWYHDQLGAIAC